MDVWSQNVLSQGLGPGFSARVFNARHAIVAASNTVPELKNAPNSKNGAADAKRILVVGSTGYIGKYVVRI